VAATSFGMAYKTGNGSLNTTVKRLGSYNNSTLGRLIGTTERNAKNVQAVIISMIAWLTASLRSSSLTTIAEIAYDVKSTYHLRSFSKKNLIKYGNTRLGIRNGTNNNNMSAAQALLNLKRN
jgi:hypothetical protein